MKRIFTIAAALLMTASVWAQAPEKMSYQAVVRDAGNALVTSTAVSMQISILQNTATGTAVYLETQAPTSNANGLVSLEIGSGTAVLGAFNTIDWSAGPYFIKTETDPTGGTNYTISGTSQLMSVPYALHAKTAENITGGITETDPVFGASIANGITVLDTANWNNHTVDTDTQLDENQVDAFVANNGYLTSEVDSSVTNEIELPTGGFNGQVLKTDGYGNYAWVNPTVGGNGIYGGDGTTPSGTDVTVTDHINIDANTLFVDGTNNSVGIGIDSATTAKLVIAGNATEQGLDLSTTDQYANMRVIQNTNSTTDKDIFLGFGSGTSSSLHLYSDNNETMSVKGSKVGIGIAAPSAKLDVAGKTRTLGLQVTTGAGTPGQVLTSDASGNATWQASGSSGHYIGELFGGGIVFYVYNNGANGLIASLVDLDGGSGVAWSGNTSTLIGATAQSFYDGASNTAAMVAQDGTANKAGTLCDDYTGSSQTDWYLPASWELNLLYESAFTINTILENDGNGNSHGLNPENVAPTFGNYWSSTEDGSYYAWYYYFNNGYSTIGSNKSSTFRVRAVRAF